MSLQSFFLAAVVGFVLSVVAEGFVRSASKTTTKTTHLGRVDMMTIADGDLLALDFDGVLCASSGESSYSSIVAAQMFWRDQCTISKSSPEFSLVKSTVNRMRPIIETGFENMLLVRVLLEELQQDSSIKEFDTNAMMASWSPSYRDGLIARFGSSKAELVDFFGGVRDSLIAEDLAAWVGLNEIYPCVRASLSNTFISPKRLDCKIITTKQKRFVRAILDTNGISCPADEDIYDLDNPFGPKVKVLAELLRQQTAAGLSSSNSIHFVEDRFETLESVMRTPGLDSVQLYLVDWGYNTEAQRVLAKSLAPRIQLIDGDAFQALVGKFIR